MKWDEQMGAKWLAQQGEHGHAEVTLACDRRDHDWTEGRKTFEDGGEGPTLAETLMGDSWEWMNPEDVLHGYLMAEAHGLDEDEVEGVFRDVTEDSSDDDGEFDPELDF